MLLLHGFPELWTMWEHQITAFKDEYNVAAIDMRGYGRSDRPPVGTNSTRQLFALVWQPSLPHKTAAMEGKRTKEVDTKLAVAGKKGLLHRQAGGGCGDCGKSLGLQEVCSGWA